MARLLIPQNPRTYNPNARGAVTTIVHMRANNPFESNRALVTRPAMALRGQMAGLGEGTAPASTGIDWGALAEKVGSGVIKQLVPQQPAPAPVRVTLPPAGMSTTTKVLIASGVGLVGLLAILMLKK